MARPPSLVLGYHNLLPTAAFGGDDSALTSFRSQLSAVARRCTVVPLVSDEPTGPAHRPAVALTFDDGYLDNATVVAGLLLDLELPATFFLVSSFLDGTDYPWWEVVAATCAHPGVTRLEVAGHRLDLTSAGARADARRRIEALCLAADLTERDKVLADLRDSAGQAGAEAVSETVARTPMMTWSDARALRDAGFSIGSHTSRHAILARVDASVVAAELRESKQRLESELGAEVTAFAYPNGAANDFDDTAVRLVREEGYHHAVSTVPGINTARTDPLRLRRLVVEPQMSGATLARAAATQLGGSAARRVVSLVRAKRPATRTPRPSS